MSPEELLKAAQACPPELMREMAKAANRDAARMIAQRAREFSRDPMVAGLKGPAALRAFADAMDATTAKVWGGAA
ncbi:MAG: hypothetical protein K2X46_15070 [Roseomonas sp.]|nr:hypothetical protein [Roseomonas sp.]